MGPPLKRAYAKAENQTTRQQRQQQNPQKHRQDASRRQYNLRNTGAITEEGTDTKALTSTSPGTSGHRTSGHREKGKSYSSARGSNKV